MHEFLNFDSFLQNLASQSGCVKDREGRERRGRGRRPPFSLLSFACLNSSMCCDISIRIDILFIYKRSGQVHNTNIISAKKEQESKTNSAYPGKTVHCCQWSRAQNCACALGWLQPWLSPPQNVCCKLFPTSQKIESLHPLSIYRSLAVWELGSL